MPLTRRQMTMASRASPSDRSSTTATKNTTTSSSIRGALQDSKPSRSSKRTPARSKQSANVFGNDDGNDADGNPLLRKKKGCTKNILDGEHNDEDGNEGKTSGTVRDQPDRQQLNDDDDEDAPQFVFGGKTYDSYQEMVDAKRRRNQEMLQDLGLVSLAAQRKRSNAVDSTASQRGLKRQKVDVSLDSKSRRSKRISGSKIDHVALEYDAHNAIIAVNVEGKEPVAGQESNKEAANSYLKGRINDGSDLSLAEAIDCNGVKWIKEDSLNEAKRLKDFILNAQLDTKTKESSEGGNSPTFIGDQDHGDDAATADIQAQMDALSIDNEEWVAKVTPGRIYCVSTHPSESKIIVGAGDKEGYVGLWDVDAPPTAGNNGVSLFRPHSRPICCMEWMNQTSMVTASYDGTVRYLDVEKGAFREIFATHDDSDSFYAEELGYGLDEGYRYWIQHVSVDHRNSTNRADPCLFLATSVGKAMHLDLRVAEKQRITFHQSLSEKKINSLSLHQNGHTLASGGLDGIVRLWDIRKFQTSSTNKKTPTPVATQQVGLSISSAFFSPSGKALVSTSFTNKLDIIHDPHLQTGSINPTQSIKHNNQTGRWLSTFMATWHPQLDIFVVGSMSKPRCMEAFDVNGKLLRAVTGDALSAVMSRCCFHSSTNRIAMIGGNSSGRVVVVR